MTEEDRESARKYVNGTITLLVADAVIEAFEEPHEDCRIKSVQDWIKSRAYQLNYKAEREKGLHPEICDHCAKIEHLLTVLVERGEGYKFMV